GIGQADELDEDPAQRIADAEDRRDDAGPPEPAEPARADEDDEEEQEALEPGFIELARMARQGVGVGRKDDGPWQIGRRPVELAVDEVGDADEEDADGADGTEQIEARKDRAALASGEERHGDEDADKAAVKAHATVPEGNNLLRVRGVVGQVVK